MAANYKNLAKWLGVVIAVAAIAAVFALQQPTPRRYPNRIAVHFWHRWGGEWAKVVDNICQRYNESQDKYEVIALGVSGGSDIKFRLGVLGGDPPDVMSMWNGAIPDMADNGLLTDLQTLMSPADKDYFFNQSYPVVRDSGIVNGKVCGVTIGSDLYALYLNVDQLKAAGLDADNPPKTLEELCDWGEKLTVRDKSGNVKRLGFLLNQLDYLAYSFGGGLWDSETQRIVTNSQDNIRALQAISDFRQRMGQDKVQRFQASLNSGSDTGGWPFITGELAMTLDGQWRVEEIRKYSPKMRYRVIPIPPPATNGRPLGGCLTGNFMIIPTTARQKEGAWDFIRYWSGFSDLEASAQCFNDGGWLPLSPKVVQTKTFQKWLQENQQFQTFLDIAASANCQPLPPVPYLQYLLDGVAKAEDRTVRGELSPKAALDDLNRVMQRELAKRKELGYAR
jgi:multiple sugar transport system substrate-binding protein